MSRITASPSAASSATSSDGDERAMSAARTERGGREGVRADRIPRSSTRHLTRQAVSVSSSCQVPVGTRPATTSSAARSRITSPMRARCGTSSAAPPGSRAISRNPRVDSSSVRVSGRRVARRRRARSSVVSTSKRAHAAEPRSRDAKPASSRARGAALSASQPSSARSAPSRSPATTNASALKRLLATTSPAIGERRSSRSSSARSARLAPPAYPIASMRPSAPCSASRAAAVNHRPQWNGPAPDRPRAAAGRPPLRAGRGGATGRRRGGAARRPRSRRGSRTAVPAPAS